MPYENYLTEYGAEEIRFGKMIDDSAVGEAIINGGLGGGGTSLTPSGVATGIDTSSDIDAIKETLQNSLTPAPISVSIPNTQNTNIPLTLPRHGFYQITVSSGSITGGLTISNNGINLILNTGTIQTENIQGTYRDYYIWVGSTSVIINTGTNTSSSVLVFTPISNAPDPAQSFSGFIFLEGNGSTQISSKGFSYLHINNTNFTISEGAGIFTPRYVGWLELTNTSFTITNSTGTSQLYYFKLSNYPNNAGTSALLDSTIRSEGASALNRTVIAGVTNTGATKTPVLDSSGRFQVTDSQLLTIANRDSLDYPELFTVFGATNSSYSVKTPTNRYIVKSLFCRNNSGSNLFFQLFNKSSTPELGDIPLLSILVQPNSSLILGTEFFASKGFLLPQVASGTVYAAQSSTEGTYTPSNNNISIHLFGVDRVI